MKKNIRDNLFAAVGIVIIIAFFWWLFSIHWILGGLILWLTIAYFQSLGPNVDPPDSDRDNFSST